LLVHAGLMTVTALVPGPHPRMAMILADVITVWYSP